MNREAFSRTCETKDEWETPKYFFELLDEIFHFTLDPCASPSNAKCKKFHTIEDDGLLQDWSGESVFVNPPFSHVKDWVQKCYKEGIKENTVVVMILPSRTDTIYWHEYIMKANEIWFCKGRVNFLLNNLLPKNSSSTFPLAVVVFESETKSFPLIKSFGHKQNNRGSEQKNGLL